MFHSLIATTKNFLRIKNIYVELNVEYEIYVDVEFTLIVVLFVHKSILLTCLERHRGE